MPEPASVSQKSQVGLETVEGTAVAAAKQLTSLGLAFTPMINIKASRATGTKWPSVAIPGKEWAESDLDGDLTYTEVIYPLAGCIGNLTTTNLGGSPTAYQHDFLLRLSQTDVVQSFTVEQGDPLTRARRIAGVKFDAFGFDFDRDGAVVKGHALGKAIEFARQLSTNATYTLTANASPPTAGTFTLTYSAQTTAAIAFDATPAAVQSALEALSNLAVGDVVVTATVATGTGKLDTGNNVYTIEFRANKAQQPITLTGTFTGLTASGSIALAAGVTGVVPTSLDLVPVAGPQLSVYLDDTWANLGTTRLTGFLKGEWGISDRFSPVWVVNQLLSSYKATVEAVPAGEVNMTLEADEQWESFLDELRAGTKVYQRIEAVGAAISGGNNYRLRVDSALILTDLSDLGDEDDVFGATYSASPTYDPASGNIVQVRVVNTLATL